MAEMATRSFSTTLTIENDKPLRGRYSFSHPLCQDVRTSESASDKLMEENHSVHKEAEVELDDREENAGMDVEEAHEAQHVQIEADKSPSSSTHATDATVAKQNRGKSQSLLRRAFSLSSRPSSSPYSSQVPSSQYSQRSTFSSLLSQNERLTLRPSMKPLQEVEGDIIYHALTDLIENVVPSNM